ncbi:reverse transcriptase domain-containing protein [Tanacetum coccineum]|uniref:Reverse transcriptase domain-containing protein n=1 Tax=Tanacetum coccineum TaxID=301880 RepID=A0ABQ5FQT2_9ASTR
MVAGKKILISEEPFELIYSLMMQMVLIAFLSKLLDSLIDIGYEGNLAQLTFSKPLFSPQWKYLVHVLLHCLSPKSTSWEQFGTNIASALVGLHLDSTYVKWSHELAAEEEHSTSPHSRAASSARDAQGTQGTAQAQDTDEVQDTDPAQGAAAIPKSPNDYTPTDASQTSGGDEGLLDLYALNREVKRLKRQTLSQAKQIIKLKTKLKKLSKFVQPVVKHHAFWVESQNLKKRRKKQRKKHTKKVSSVNVGGIMIRKRCCYTDFERKSDETEALERKSDETKEINDLNFDDEAGPSSPIRPTQNIEPEEQFKVDEVLADISRPRGLSIPGPIQPQPQQPSQATDPKDKGKGILVEEPKKKKLTLQQIRALETTNDEEVQKEFKLNRMQKRKKSLKEALSEDRNNDALRNYLKIVDFEQNAHDREVKEGIEYRSYNHLRFFNKVTSTFRHPEVPNTSIKLLLFPFSLDDEARDWLDKEPPRSILTWDDLVSKFINQFFPPSKTTYLRNKITIFFQEPNETFNKVWERFKGLLRQCPHHGFSELHQLDTFYNSLSSNDQDALDSAAGGNFLDKMPQEGLAIIESKSKFLYSKSCANDSRGVSKTDFENYVKANDAVLKNVQNQGCKFLEPDPRVPIILGRPFLRTAKALIDLYEEKLTLRVGKDELVYYAEKSEKNMDKNFVHAISIIDFSKTDPFSGSTTTHSNDPSPSSSPMKTSDNFEKFADELAPLDSLPPGNDKSTLKKDLHEENFQDHSNPLLDEMKKNYESSKSNILKIQFYSTHLYPDKGLRCYFDSEGDVTFLDNLLSDDDSHNLVSEVITDHEPEQIGSSITFSPRSDPLHHEFAGEPLTLPARNDRKNVHQSSVIESLLVSPIPVEDSEPTQGRNDIFLFKMI